MKCGKQSMPSRISHDDNRRDEMKEEVDARGLACPQPVIMAKNTIEERGDCVVIVDDEAARENVCRMAVSLGCDVRVDEKDGVAYIHISRGDVCEAREDRKPSAGPTVIVFPYDKMGRGDDELGTVLIKAFLHTLGEVSPRPDVIIFFNAGVKLATEGSDVLNDLSTMENQGIGILVCGTCLDYFGLKDNLKVGVVSNMYDIAETMLSAGRVIRI
jgi:selenium metabolism protein YedF